MKYPEHEDKLKDKLGRYRTMSLFREFYLQEKGQDPIWCLKDDDPQGTLPSLKKFYMEVSDPTEYEFAMQAFGSWQHWLKIKSARAIQKFVEDWPIELEVKLRSEGIRAVTEEALVGRSKFNAAKLDAEIGEDAERLGLTLIKN